MNEATVNLGGSFTTANLGTFNRTGGTINLEGVLDLAGGVLTLDATTGSWNLVRGTIKGGTVRQTAGARLNFAASGILDALRVEGDLVLTNFNPSASTVIRNGLTLQGSVVLENGGRITFGGDQTFDGSQIVFAGNSGFLGIEPGTTLTLGPNMVVHGKSGTVQGSAFGTVRLINQGLLWADTAGGTVSFSLSEFTNAGILRASDGAILRITSPQFIDTGTIEELTGGDVRINP